MRRLVLVAGLLYTLTASTPTSAAEEVTERAVPGPSSTLQQPALTPRATIPALTVEQQLAALQQQVQSLQAQVAALQSVFKVTAGGATIQAQSLSFISAEGTLIQSGKDIAISASRDVTVSASRDNTVSAGSTFKVASAVATIQPQALSLSSTMGTTIQSSKGIAITAGTGLAMQSQTGTSLKAGSSMLVETSGTLDLKGATTRLNGGNKPIATVGSAVGNGLILNGSQTILGN